MFFNSKAKREKRIKEYEEHERRLKENLEETRKKEEAENKEAEKYYELYKNDEDIIKMVKRFYECNSYDSPSKFVFNSSWNFELDSPIDLTNKAYIQIDQERMRFYHCNGGYISEILFKNCGFANIEDPIKQKAILLVFRDYFIQEAKKYYASKGQKNLSVSFRLEKVYTTYGSPDVQYDTRLAIGVKEDEYRIRYYWYDKHMREGVFEYYNGAVIKILNNQPNVLRQL